VDSSRLDFPQVSWLRLPAQQRLGVTDLVFFNNQMALQVLYFLGFFFCKLACFGYKSILLFWFQRIVKVSLLCLQSEQCMLFAPADLLLDCSLHTVMNQEVSTHTTTATTSSRAAIIVIDQGLAAVLAMLEPRQRSAPSTLHTYVVEGGVKINEL